MVNKFTQFLLNSLYPPLCYMCLSDSEDSLHLCEACRNDLPNNGICCPLCAQPQDLETSSVCGACLQQPPIYSSCIAPLRYQAPVSEFIHAFKYHSDLAAGRLLAELLATKLNQHDAMFWPDVIIPVPMHWTRLWRKGFNHSIRLALFLNKSLHKKIPVMTNLCRKINRSVPQSQLDAKTRQGNLSGAFLADSCKGLKNALLDDVITTGSTINACSKALIDAGAADIQIWAIARTPRRF